MGLDIIHHVKDKKLDSERKVAYFLSHEESRGNNSVEGRLHEQERMRGEGMGSVMGTGAVGYFDHTLTLTPKTTNEVDLDSRTKLATTWQ